MRAPAMLVALAMTLWADLATGQVQGTVTTGQDHYSPGTTMAVSLAIANGPSRVSLDFYFGVLLPDGQTILYFTDLSFSVARATLSNVRALRPIARAVGLSPGDALQVPQFFRHTWTGGEPQGRYTIFLAGTPAGAGFGLDRLVLLQLKEVSFSLVPPVVSRLVPDSATSGAVVRVFGSGFGNGSVVTFGGRVSPWVIRISDTELRAAVPFAGVGTTFDALPPGAYAVAVDGGPSVPFQVLSLPPNPNAPGVVLGGVVDRAVDQFTTRAGEVSSALNALRGATADPQIVEFLDALQAVASELGGVWAASRQPLLTTLSASSLALLERTLLAPPADAAADAGDTFLQNRAARFRREALDWSAISIFCRNVIGLKLPGAEQCAKLIGTSAWSEFIAESMVHASEGAVLAISMQAPGEFVRSTGPGSLTVALPHEDVPLTATVLTRKQMDIGVVGRLLVVVLEDIETLVTAITGVGEVLTAAQSRAFELLKDVLGKLTVPIASGSAIAQPIQFSSLNSSCISPSASPVAISLAGRAQWTGTTEVQGNCHLELLPEYLTPSEQAAFNATFLRPVTLRMTVVGNGRVTSTPAGIDCTSTGGFCLYRFANGATVTLTATPGTVQRWTLPGCSSASSCTGVLRQDTEVTANFVTERSVSIPPTATYLLTNEDPSTVGPVAIFLSTIGATPGSTVRIVPGGSIFICTPDFENGCPRTPPPMMAAFTAGAPPSSAANLPTGREQFISDATLFGGIVTDQQNDFSVFGTVDVVVPPGAAALWLAIHDRFYSDNTGFASAVVTGGLVSASDRPPH